MWEARDLSRRVTINLPRPIVPASASPCSNCFVVSEKQKWLVVGGPSSMLQCWDLKTLRFSHAVAMPGWNAVRQLHPMPDDRTVAGAA